MSRLTKDKKRVLIDQLSFNFEENIVEHYYKKLKEEKIEEQKFVFKKENVAIKITNKKRKHHGRKSKKNSK